MTPLSKLLLEYRCEVPVTNKDREELLERLGEQALSLMTETKAHPMWSKLYYGEQPKKAREHLAKLAQEFPKEAEIFAPAVELMLAQMARHEAERMAAKAALQLRREARATQAALRSALGVNLEAAGGVIATEATYKTVRAGIKPIEDELRQWLTDRYTAELEAFRVKLRAHDWDAGKAYPYRNHKGVEDPNHIGMPSPMFWRVIEGDDVSGNRVRVCANAATVIANTAAADASEAVAGFAGKLTGKIDSVLAAQNDDTKKPLVESVSCAGNMWDNSILTVATNYGVQRWHTKIIWNRSVLGKSFRQWPTRQEVLEADQQHAPAFPLPEDTKTCDGRARSQG